MDKINIKSKPGYLKKAVYIFSLAVVIGSGYSVWQAMKIPTKEPQVYVQESCSEDQDCGKNAVCIGDFAPSENLDSIAQFRLDQDGYYYTMLTEDNNLWQTKYKPGEGTRATFKWSFQEWFNNIDWNGIDPISINDPIDSMAIFKLDEDGYYYTMITQGTNLWQTKYKPGEGTTATFKWSFKEWSSNIDWNGIDPINASDPIDSMNIFKDDGDGYYYTDITQGTNVWQTKYKPDEGTKANLKWDFSEWANRINWEGIESFSPNDPIGAFSAYKKEEDGYYYSAIVQGNNIWQTKYKSGEGTEAIFRWSFKEWFDKIDWGEVEAFKSCDCECGYDNCNDNWADGCEADLLNDINNCGGCGVVCGSNEICVAAECVAQELASPNPSPSNEENCADGKDNDGDGKVDCADIDCNARACSEGDVCCTNGICTTDMDADGYVNVDCGGQDCNDNDRMVYPDAPEDCNDQKDNDCDGDTDCYDFDCASNPESGCCPVGDLAKTGCPEEFGCVDCNGTCFQAGYVCGSPLPSPSLSPSPSPSDDNDVTKLNIQVKFDGVPANNNDYCCLGEDCDPRYCNLRDRYRNLEVQFAIQAEDNTYVIADYFDFEYNPDTKNYHRTFTFGTQEMLSGGYNFLIKGPNHRRIRFCKENQGINELCSRDEYVQIVSEEEKTLNFALVDEGEQIQPMEFGDVDEDHVVGVKDYSIIKECMNSKVGDDKYEAEGDYAEDKGCWAADGNFNGVVDDTDKYLFQKTITHKQDDE